MTSHVQEMVYVRCHALVQIQLFPTSKDVMQTYAQRVDKRLKEIVCR